MILRWEKFPPSSKDNNAPAIFLELLDLAGTSPPHDGGQTSLPRGFLERAGPRSVGFFSTSSSTPIVPYSTYTHVVGKLSVGKFEEVRPATFFFFRETCLPPAAKLKNPTGDGELR